MERVAEREIVTRDAVDCEEILEIRDKKVDILRTQGTDYWFAWVVLLTRQQTELDANFFQAKFIPL